MGVPTFYDRDSLKPGDSIIDRIHEALSHVAVVPVYQQPVERFKLGHGELTLGIEGPAFNLWEALLHFPREKFPMFVAGEIIHRSEPLGRAGVGSP